MKYLLKGSEGLLNWVIGEELNLNRIPIALVKSGATNQSVFNANMCWSITYLVLPESYCPQKSFHSSHKIFFVFFSLIHTMKKDLFERINWVNSQVHWKASTIKERPYFLESYLSWSTSSSESANISVIAWIVLYPKRSLFSEFLDVGRLRVLLKWWLLLLLSLSLLLELLSLQIFLPLWLLYSVRISLIERYL